MLERSTHPTPEHSEENPIVGRGIIDGEKTMSVALPCARVPRREVLIKTAEEMMELQGRVSNMMKEVAEALEEKPDDKGLEEEQSPPTKTEESRQPEQRTGPRPTK